MRLRALELGLLLAWMALPSVANADDAAIAQQLSETLKAAQSAGELEGFRLSVNVEDGTVWVKGRVANEAQRTLALDRARRIAGVRLVVNDIEVGGPVVGDGSRQEKSIARAASVVPIPTQSAAAPRPQARPARVQPSYPVPVSARPIQYVEGMPIESEFALEPLGCNPSGGCYSSGGYPAQDYVSGPPAAEYGGYGGSYSGGVNYEQPQMPGYAWPSYAANQNYGAVTYPQQYSPMAWPYIGPFYPYPQVPLGWRKVTLEWDDGWWMLDFKHK